MTDPTPATTAADVRNAYQVMSHLGHARGEWVDPDEATVCLDGALRLATSYSLQTFDSSSPLRFTDSWINDFTGTLTTRYRDAQQAVRPHLPDCDCHTPLERRHLDTTVLIAHYNDLHCTGGPDAQEILRVTAEKLEADL